MAVKQLVMAVLLVASSTLALEVERRERRVHPSLLTSCIAEQLSSGLEDVRACLSCFQGVGDALSQTGLEKAQLCTDTWLPREAADCQAELAVLSPDNVEASQRVIACFDHVKHIMSAEDCLARTANTDDVIQTLTDGVLCLQNRQHSLSAIVNKIFEKEIKEEFERVQEYIKENNISPPPPPKKDPLADQLTALVFKRHCIIASSSGEEEAACNSCFKSHLPGNLNSLPSPEEHFRSLANCAATHLTPLYDSCTDLLQEVIKDPRANGHLGHQVFLCFTRVVTQHQVEECAQKVEEVTSEALLDVMGCGTHSVNTWVRDNVSPPPPPPSRQQE